MSRMKEHVMAEIAQIGREPVTEAVYLTLVEALADAQADMRNPTFDKVNPHFKSKFASLAAVRDAVIPVLSRHGIALTQTYALVEGAQILRTTLHRGHETIVSEVPLPAYTNSQQWASATTYIRRVSLMAIAGVCGDEDDDAEAAVQTARKAPEKAAPDGFEAWWRELEAAAQKGSEALKAAWSKAPTEVRTHAMQTRGQAWESLKAAAAKVNA